MPSDGRIRISENAGYCYGVERALKLTRQAAESMEHPPIYTFGPIIHNPAVVESLRLSGVEVVEDLTDLESGTLIIRSHGIEKELLDEASSRLTIVDATCPFVKKAQKCAGDLRADGYQVLIVGERDHPEVIGILSYAGPDALVVESEDCLPEELGERIGVVVQTTQSQKTLRRIVGKLLDRVAELKVFNTICSATELRQEGARELAADRDLIIVVGGRNSANTSRLAKICADAGALVHHIETAEELRPEWFDGASRIGITGGASTPEYQISDVFEAISRLLG